MKTIQVRVKPNARVSVLEEVVPGQWLAKLKSPPVDGRASQELIELIAQHFELPRSAVSIKSGATPHVAWQAIQYFLLSLGEVLVSVTALEFAYTQAPRTLKTTILSLWFVTSGTGSLLTGVIAEVNVFSGPTFYWFFTGLQLVAAAVFTAGAVWYKPALQETSIQAPEPANSAA